MLQRTFSLGLTLWLVATAWACSGSDSSSPSGPSSTGVAVQAGESSTGSATTTGANGQPGGPGGPHGPGGPQDGSGVAGTVSGLRGTCPTLTFVVDGKTIQTNKDTVFDDGCAAVKNGISVGVRGTAQRDGSILAVRVHVGVPGGNGGPHGPGGPNTDGGDHVSGTVAGLTGNCPALSFTLAQTKVTTNRATVFGSGACADLKVGAAAVAIGTKQSDGSVLASRVHVGEPQGPPR